MGEKLLDVFRNELVQIKGLERRNFVEKILLLGSDDLMTWQSSSTGKYHPGDEIRPEGMIIHIKRCVMLAPDTARMFSLGKYGEDLLIAGSLVHDLWKRGENNDAHHTASDHMIIAFKMIMNLRYDGADSFQTDLARIVLHHEGKWSPPDAHAYADGASGDDARAMHAIDMFTTRRRMWECMLPEFSDAVVMLVQDVT